MTGSFAEGSGAGVGRGVADVGKGVADDVKPVGAKDHLAGVDR
jgi:hypothetical protein